VLPPPGSPIGKRLHMMLEHEGIIGAPAVAREKLTMDVQEALATVILQNKLNQRRRGKPSSVLAAAVRPKELL